MVLFDQLKTAIMVVVAQDMEQLTKSTTVAGADSHEDLG